MEDQTPITIEGTDILYQEFRLYIEGVQVPFASINISTGLGILPTAAITVPITLGITDISRNYSRRFWSRSLILTQERSYFFSEGTSVGRTTTKTPKGLRV